MKLLHFCLIALLGGTAVGLLFHFARMLARAAAISEALPR
jgi:hypothetical protein